jgi:putative alpha-1,2-mannosidase
MLARRGITAGAEEDRDLCRYVDPLIGTGGHGHTFPGATVPFAGRTLVIEARNNAPEHSYIQSVRWNAQPHSRVWISHAELNSGGHLVFELGPKPNPAYGAALEDRPPSFGHPPSPTNSMAAMLVVEVRSAEKAGAHDQLAGERQVVIS